MTASLEREFVLLLSFYVFGFILESWTSAEDSNPSVVFNLKFTALRTLFDLTAGAWFGVWITRAVGLSRPYSLISISTGGSIALSLALALAGLLVRDFFYYWFHRLQHASSWMWAEHELHHSDESMNVTTALRHHWLETPLDVVFVVIPTALVFRQVAPTLAAYFLARSAGFFIHLNSRIDLGKLFVSPAVHRIHHSKRTEHIDKNFAAFFPLWDILFGTYCAPIRGDVPPTGLASEKRVDSLLGAALMPFVTWRKMLRLERHTQRLEANARPGGSED